MPYTKFVIKIRRLCNFRKILQILNLRGNKKILTKKKKKFNLQNIFGKNFSK